MSGKPAARVTDPTTCPIPGHGTNPIASGSGDVFFNGLAAARLAAARLAAARLGDSCTCGQALSGAFSATVFINGLQ